MGFRCQKCNKVSQPCEKQYPIVLEKRDKVYHYYVVKVRGHYNKNKEVITETKPDERDKTKQIVRQFSSKGWEIAKLIKVCEECANEKT